MSRLIFFQVCFAAAVGASLVPNGSVSPPNLYFTGLILALVMLPAGLIKVQHRDLTHLIGIVLAVTLMLVFYAILQSRPLPHAVSHLAHPVWHDVQVSLGTVETFISVTRGYVLEGAMRLILPAAVFISAVLVSQNEHDGRRFWHMLTAIGLFVSGLSVLLELVFPDVHWFASRPIGVGSLTGVFSNRNISGAFFTMTAFSVLGSIALLRAAQHRQNYMSQSDPWHFLLTLALFGLAISIVLSLSRASSGFGLATLFLAAASVFTPSRLGRPGAPRAGILAAIVAIGVLIVFFGVFGEPVLSRLETDDTSARWCVFVASWNLYWSEPVFGLGFSTFSDVFPSARPVDCVSSSGVWLRAHNTFVELSLGFGLFGVAAVIIAYSTFLSVCVSALRTRKQLRGFSSVVFFFLVYLTLHSFFDFPLQIPGLSYYAAAMLGCGLALMKKRPRAPADISRSRKDARHTSAPARKEQGEFR
jgi:hypothetical protein